ncbi:hypothetical protein [Tahibacter soli]|uniref:Secreted protein n=1 Tax=Tahibacter soli TaxID=2983605 RepID=A0A9X3YJ84_9GAMM|nr:hypothetical protein [Tahibacter soli]MDC8012125.1 hypothetical protein [Tahibacter soli]
MRSPRLISIVALFAAANVASAAGVDCAATADGYRCEAWPRGERYTYYWNTVGNMRVSESGASADPSRRIDCVAGRYGAVAVTVVAPAGYVETATQTLRGCPAAAQATAHAVAGPGTTLLARDGI